MLRWLWIRLREGVRWVFRGTNYTKLEQDIRHMSAPLASGRLDDTRASKARDRIKIALSYLPRDVAEKYYEMMDRYGHSVRS